MRYGVRAGSRTASHSACCRTMSAGSRARIKRLQPLSLTMNLKPFPGLYVPSIRDFRRAVQKWSLSQVMRCTDDFQPDDFSSLRTADSRAFMSVRRSKGVGKADKIAPFCDGKADREARRLQRHDVSGRISARVRITAGLPLLPCMTGSGFTLHIARPDCIRGGRHSRWTRCSCSHCRCR